MIDRYTWFRFFELWSFICASIYLSSYNSNISEIKYETTTEDPRADEINVSSNLKTQKRKKRNVDSIDIGQSIIEKAISISESTLDDPNASSRETQRAEELFVYSKDLEENLEAIDESNISDKEKAEIVDKLEGIDCGFCWKFHHCLIMIYSPKIE